MAGERPMLPPGTLQDKVILITGAGTGIGEAAAIGFARAWAKLMLTGRRLELVEKVAEAIRNEGGDAFAIRTDVAEEEQVRSMVDQTLARFGRLDGAFNNAGVEQTPGRVAEMSVQDLDYTWSVKGRGTFLCMKYEIPAMIKSAGGGSIVNHGSVVSERTFPQYPAPAATQGAIPGLTKSAAAGHGPDNIRVNMIFTGCVLIKEKRASGPDAEERIAALARRTALNRVGTAEDVAAMAGWLLSDYSSFVTGVCVPVDGGNLAKQ